MRAEPADQSAIDAARPERQTRQYMVGAAAGTAFVQAMESVCPGDPVAAFAQLLKRRSFQRFLPEHVRKALGKHALRNEALKLRQRRQR